MKNSTNGKLASNTPKWKWFCTLLVLCVSALFANAQSVNFSQVTTNPPTDPLSWVYGILNKHNSQYTEGMAVPQRISVVGIPATDGNTHTLTFKVQYQRKNGTNYAFDFLSSWATAVANAGGKLDQLSSVECTPHSGGAVASVCGSSNLYTGTITGDISDEQAAALGTDLTAYLDAPATRNFSIYSTVPVSSATITSNGTEDDGSNTYQLYTVAWTNDDPAGTQLDVVIEFAAHLAKTRDGYNGSGYIKGAPYHLKLGKLDDSSLGSQDNNVTVFQGTCKIVVNDITLTTCATPGANTGSFDLTSTAVTDQITSTPGVSITWYSDVDLTTEINDPGTFSATDGTVIYAVVSNNACESVATVTLTVNPLPVALVLTAHDFCASSPNSGSITSSTSENEVSYQLYDGSNTAVGAAQDGTGSGLSWTGLSAGTGYYVVGTGYAPATCTSTSNTVNIVENPTPPCTLSATRTTTVGKTEIYSSTYSADYSYSWSITANTANAGFVGSHGTTDASVQVVTTQVGSYTINLTTTNINTGCSNTCSTVVTVNGIPGNTYTKGFWGTINGNFCEDLNSKVKTNVVSWMATQVGTSKNFGSLNSSYNQFTLYGTVFTNTGTAQKPVYQFFQLMPGGSTPSKLTCDASSTPKVGWSCVPIVSDVKASNYGSIQNNLLAQTIAMFFNLKKYSVGTTVLPDNVLTFAPTQGATCATSGSTQTIPWCVFDYLNGPSNDQPVTVQAIYDLANEVLGANPAYASISASDANAALNAINVGFDKGETIVAVGHNTACVQSTITTRQVEKATDLQTNELTVSAYPNPYTTKVNFTITSPVSGKANLQVYNVIGQNVKTIYTGYMMAGQKQTVSFDVPPAMRTMLFYKLQVGDQQVTGKVLQAKTE